MHIPSFYLIGISIRTTNENQQAAQDIPALWQRFMENNMASEIPHKLSDELYCVYTEYEKDYTRPYTTVLGCKVSSLDQIPEGMSGWQIPESDYQIFRASGKQDEPFVLNEWMRIWDSEIKRRYTADFEIYGAEAHHPEQAKVDIYISIPGV